MTSLAAPALGRPTRRLVGVDAARGVALLGMFAVHLLPGLDLDGPTWTAELTRGRSSAAFATLAGVAVALANGGRTPLRGRGWAAASAGMLVRCALIGALGLLLGLLESGLAVILVFYALLFALTVPLLGLRARWLAVVAVLAVVVVPVVSHLLRADWPPMRGTSPVPADLLDPLTLLRELSFTGYYPVLAWLAYLAGGMAVGRLALGRRVALAVAVGGAALAAGALVASRLLVDAAGTALPPGAADRVVYGTTPTSTWWWLATAGRHSSTPFDLAHTLGTAYLLLGVLLLVGSYARAAVVLRPLALVGSMTLTLYTLHVLAVADGLGPTDPEALWVVHALAAFAVALLLRRLEVGGPLETLVGRASAAARGAVLRAGRGAG